MFADSHERFRVNDKEIFTLQEDVWLINHKIKPKKSTISTAWERFKDITLKDRKLLAERRKMKSKEY